MQKSNKVVLFDIDYTIFNTKNFRELLYPRLAEKLGYTTEEFTVLGRKLEGTVKRANNYFSLYDWLEVLLPIKKTHVTLEELEAVSQSEELYTESLYEEAHDVFETLTVTHKIPIVIFSTGDKRFQTQKITGLRKFLKDEHFHIYVDKLQELPKVLEQYKDSQIFIIDDFLTILEHTKKHDSSAVTIWVQTYPRPDDLEILSRFTPDYTVTNLLDIAKIVEGK